MREQDQLARPGALQDRSDPRNLIGIERVIGVGGIQPDDQPMAVLQGKVARRLLKSWKDFVEIREAAGIHFMITIERSVYLTRAYRPDIQEALLHFTIGS